MTKSLVGVAIVVALMYLAGVVTGVAIAPKPQKTQELRPTKQKVMT